MRIVFNEALKASLALVIFFLITIDISAQHKKDKVKLEHQIRRIDSAFSSSITEDFDHVFPLESVREIYASAVAEKFARQPGKSKILFINRDSAYVLLTGLFRFGNSGDETNFSNKYTGIYKFEKIHGAWQLMDRIDTDRFNRIARQNIAADFSPGKEIHVIDTLTIDVNDFTGFAARLNHKANIKVVSLNGHETEFIFSGGLLWIRAAKGTAQKLVLDYVIDEIEQDDKNKNSSFFSSEYGHLRNQYYWHPFFSFSSPHDRADFVLKITIPNGYHLSTSLTQKDTISGNYRIVTARSGNPTFGLSVYYDSQWEPNIVKAGETELAIYTTKDFSPGSEQLKEYFLKCHTTLQQHFGKPISNYLGIVQDRTSGNGWKNRSNSIIVAGKSGSYLITDNPQPRAVFGHEIAHGWTSPSGPATNFLMEGWATYTESIILASVYGDTIIEKFFQSQRDNYFNGNFEGNRSLWEDYSNSGVSYSKGAWLFYMIEHKLGRDKFFEMIKQFVRTGNQTIQAFIAEVSKAAGTNMETFIFPWLKSKQIPFINVRLMGNTFKIEQKGDLFTFPLEIQLKFKNGKITDTTFDIQAREQVFELQEGEIESYVLDPRKKLLHRAEKQ